ncbi:hypothetical protein DBV05_g9795 [Lasiodiplodia theobromae]|uniref:Uncharacterized protein n=1 Tax=Lasiodiplodia theobromae TaxID=45133 RepID=A0A5N5D1K8_9PEZI|nr:hypothetical protein DBV05_g9795 [Lasiodiplodia theobromae]
MERDDALTRNWPCLAACRFHRRAPHSGPKFATASRRLRELAALAHARHFRSTPSAFFDDFNDTESFLRQLQGAKKLKDQKKVQEAQKRALKAQKRDQEAPKRKPLEDQALKNKQARERREKEKKWVQACQTSQQQVQDAEAKLQLLQNELEAIPRESAKIVRQRIQAQWKRIVEQSRQRTRKQTARYGCINDATIAIQSKMAAIVDDRIDRLRSRLDSVNRAILAIQSKKAAIVNDCMDRLRSRLDGVESAILDIRSEIYAIGTRRKAVLQSLCLEIETMLPSTYWQLRYEADDLEEEINKWRPQLAAAAAQKRREERSNIYGWKAIGRRTASEIWSTLSDHMAKLLPTVHYKTELLERKLREHNPILLSRRNFAAKWRERMNEYEELGVEVSDQIHKVDVALERRYSGNSEKVLKICDTFEEVREVMMHLDQDFSKMRLYWKTLKGERDWKIYAAYGQYTRNILKVYDRIAELNMEISTLNRYIQRDIDYLVYRDQFMALFKRRNSDLEVLRNAYIIQPFEIFGKRLTGFNRVRKRMEDWYWDNRGKIIEVLGQTEWKRRRELVTKFKRAAQDWNDVRDEELYDLYNEVKRVSEQLRGLKRLEEGRERIETSLTESFFRHCEDTSFFDDQKPGDMAPTVLWAFMRMWPERYFEAGMIGLKEQMSVAQERRDKVTVHRVKGVLSKAERLAEERRHDQDKRLKLAGVYREPRYDLDKHVVEDKAAAERSNHAYFSYELYHANSERVQDEQEPLPGSPELRYHATNATHSDVLRGLGGKFVGFDLRWKPVARDEDGPKANTSLLMIATDSTIHLLHLARQRNVQPLITEEIKRVLESPDIFKVTVGSKEKCARLQKFLGVNPRGFIDLEDLHYDLQAKAGRTVSRSPLTLQDLMFEYLGYGLHPEAADMTVDLALRLRRTDQVAMGSNVYACFALWHTIYAEGQQKAEKAALLDRQRSAEQKALWERRRSIFSSFSEAPAPNSARRLPDGLSEEGADDADDFYTASKPTDSQTTSASPSLTDIWKSATETEMEKPGQDVMDAATSWVNSFLGSEEYASERPSKLIALDIVGAIKYYGMPPGNEERMAELRRLLAEDAVLPEVSPSTDGGSGDPRRHWAAAEEWAQKWARRDSERGTMFRHYEYPRRLSMLTWYRLWQNYNYSVAALRKAVFPTDFAPALKEATIANQILVVLSTWPTMDYEAPRLKELMGLLPEEVVQTSFQELAKRTGFNISAGAQGAVPVPMKADRAPKQLRKARSSTMDAAALMRMSYVGNYEEPAKEQAGNKGIETSEGNINAARRTHLRRDKRSTKEETGNEKESRASARQASYPPTRFRRAGTLRSRRQ